MRKKATEKSRRQRNKLNRKPFLEHLEDRRLLSVAAFDLIGLDEFRADPDFASIDGSGTDAERKQTIVVIDSMVDADHELLKDKIIIREDFYTRSNLGPADVHGTHVAGIIGANDEEIGVATGVQIVGLNVFPPIDNPTASDEDILDALYWSLDNADTLNIVAVNMSLGGDHFTAPPRGGVFTEYNRVITQLENAGVTVVASAGNDYAGLLPQNFRVDSGFPGIIATVNVGAVWEDHAGDGERFRGTKFHRTPSGDFERLLFHDPTSVSDAIASFSQRPPSNLGNALFAPGAGIESTIPLSQDVEDESIDGLTELDGTSMAAPMVSGAVALLQHVAQEFGGSRLAPDTLRSFLEQNADVVNDGDDERSRAFKQTISPSGIESFERSDFTYTGSSYKRLNVYEAAKAIREFIVDFGGGDLNGTIEHAIPASLPRHAQNNRPTAPSNICRTHPNFCPMPNRSENIDGSIGVDGNTSVGRDDIDIYKFDISSHVNVTFAVTGFVEGHLRLFDEGGVEIEPPDPNKAEGISEQELALIPGTYYVGVSAVDNDSYNPINGSDVKDGFATGDYSLTIDVAGADANGTLSSTTPIPLSLIENELDLEEDGISFRGIEGGVAVNFTSIIGSDPIFGDAEGRFINGDVDMYSFIAPANGFAQFDIDVSGSTHRSNNGTVSDTKGVNIFTRVFGIDNLSHAELESNDASLAENFFGELTECENSRGLVFNGFPVCTPSEVSPIRPDIVSPGVDSDSFVSFAVTRGNEYVIAVSAKNNSTYDPTTIENRTSNRSGEYTGILTYTSWDLDGSLLALRDASLLNLPFLGLNDSKSGAVVIGEDVRESTGAVIIPVAGSDDIDLIAVRPVADGILDFDVSSILSNNSVEITPTISAFTKEGTLISRSTIDNGDSSNLQIGAKANEVYLFGLSGLANDSYDIRRIGTALPSTQLSDGERAELSYSITLREINDPNGTNGSPNVVTLGSFGFVSESLGQDASLTFANSASDVDYFRLVPSATTGITVRTLSPLESTRDTKITIETPSGIEIANSTNIGSSSEVSFFGRAGDEYWVKVEGGNSGRGGDYSLLVDSLLAINELDVSSDNLGVTFNQPLDASQVSVFADVSLHKVDGIQIPGSVVISPNSDGLRFVPTGKPLTSGTYELRIGGERESFRSFLGSGYDGDGDGEVGGSFIRQFDVVSAPPDALLVSLPDFVRGSGQQVNVPATGNGVPVTISSGNQIARVEFELHYDPTYLDVTDFEVDESLTTAITSFSLIRNGVVSISVEQSNSFAEEDGELQIGTFKADVPTGAPYGGKEILSINNVKVFDAVGQMIDKPIITDDSIHIVDFVGDMNGDTFFNATDINLLYTEIASSGFQALGPLPFVDPSLVGDIAFTDGGFLTATDVSLIYRMIANDPSPIVPLLPDEFPMVTVDVGDDPRLFIPRNLTATVGQNAQIPIRVEVTEQDGIEIGSANIRLAVDTDVFDTSSNMATFTIGDLGDFVNNPDSLEPVLNPRPDGGYFITIAINTVKNGVATTSTIPHGTVVTLGTLSIPVKSEAILAPTPINVQLVADRDQTSIADGIGFSLDLVPTPDTIDANQDQVDGLVTILSDAPPP